MPLFVDNQPLNMAKEPKDFNEFEKEFFEAKKEIERLKFPLFFFQKRNVDKEKDKERISKYGNHYLPTRVFYHSSAPAKFGNVVWTYSPNQPEKNNNGVIYYKKNSEIVPAIGLRVNKNEIDKAFFLLYKSLDYKVGRLILDDKEKLATERVNEERAIIDAKALLYGSNTILKEAKLRTIARAYGVIGVNNLSDDQIRVQLDELLKVKYTKDKTAYINFVSDTNLSKELKVRSIIQQSIEQRQTYLNLPDMTYEWVVRPEEPKRVIFNFVQEDINREMETLVDFFLNEGADKYTIILNSLGIDEDVPLDFTLKTKDFDRWKREVKAYAKKNGIKAHPTRPFEEVEQEVMSHAENKLV